MSERGTAGPIVVVGTFAEGVTLLVDRPAALGETLHGSGLAIGFGGKGSNQAVACARLGARVELSTCVGRDAFGSEALALYAREGVGTRWIKQSGALPTGVGVILVVPDGSNAIVVDIGANREMDAAFVEERAAMFDGAALLVTVTEAPIAAVARSIELAHAHGLPTLLNPAPAVELPPGLLAKVSVLTPNRTELETLSGRDARRVESVGSAARELIRQGAGAVVATLGEDGALLCDADGQRHIPAPKVDVVDTTGAGDAFTAGFAVALSEGRPLAECARFAVCCGSLSCMRREVVPSLPTRAQVLDLLARQER